MDFDVNVRERILKPVNEVFNAVVDPYKMSNYFISGGPSSEGCHSVSADFADPPDSSYTDSSREWFCEI